MQWELRTTGSDSNGGGFDPTVSSPGTDESQSDSGTSYTDILIGGTTTQATSSGHAFTSTTHGPGNVINITGGTGCTVQRVEMLSQSAGTATFDKSLGTAGSTCTGTFGGGLLTVSKANSLAVTGNTINVKAGTYTLTSGVTLPAITLTWTGYNSAHGDNGTKPLITTATNSTVLFFTQGSTDATFNNISFSNTASTRAVGIQAANAHTGIIRTYRCLFDGFTNALNADNAGANFTFSVLEIKGTEFKNSTSNAIVIQPHSGNIGKYIFDGDYFHDNTGASTAALVIDSGCGIEGFFIVRATIFYNNVVGIRNDAACGYLTVVDSDFVSNTSNGIQAINGLVYFAVQNSIFYGNGGWGINDSGTTINDAYASSNAYGSNTSGDRNNFPTFQDVALSANPFVSTTNFGLNSTSGGGLALIGKGWPNAWGSSGSAGFLDIGAVQTGTGGCPICPVSQTAHPFVQ